MLLSIWTQIVDYHHGNITPTVFVWTFLGCIGAAVTVLNLVDALVDAQALRMDPSVTNSRLLELTHVAKASIRQEVLRLIKMLAIMSVGLTAAFSAPVISDQQRAALHIPYWTPIGIAITFMLILIIGIIVLQSVLDRRLRQLVYWRDR